MTLEAYRGRFFGEHHVTGVIGFPMARGLFKQLQADKKRAAPALSMEADGLGPSKGIADTNTLTAAKTALGNAGWSKPHSDAFPAAPRRPSDFRPENIPAVRDMLGDADRIAADWSLADLLARHDRFPPARSGAVL